MFTLHVVHNPSKKLRATIKHAVEQHKKVSHHKAKYRMAVTSTEDRCKTCMAYRHRDECVKVVPPISPDGWCTLGVSRKDGCHFDKRGMKHDGP